MKTNDVWVSGCIDSRILDLGTSWKRVVNFTFRPLHPRESAPATHWIGCRVGPRAAPDQVRRKSCPYRYLNSDPSAVQPVVSRYTDSCIIT
jgi:hypothetical protein